MSERIIRKFTSTVNKSNILSQRGQKQIIYKYTQ